jgi:hypothetical protein
MPRLLFLRRTAFLPRARLFARRDAGCVSSRPTGSLRRTPRQRLFSLTPASPKANSTASYLRLCLCNAAVNLTPPDLCGSPAPSTGADGAFMAIYGQAHQGVVASDPGCIKSEALSKSVGKCDDSLQCRRPAENCRNAREGPMSAARQTTCFSSSGSPRDCHAPTSIRRRPVGHRLVAGTRKPVDNTWLHGS